MENSRDKVIIKTSIIGIGANVLLAAFKAFVGFLSNSVAVILDAVNNLSDALSSLITIIGAKLSKKAPDKKHPLGYGRIEYMSAAVISVIVLYAGITSFTESVKKIIHPEKADYSAAALVIIGSAVLVKIVLGLYVKRAGERTSSDALVASGSDALFDSVISASTLAAAVIFLIWGVSLEAWLGAVISLIIIKSGIEMIRETLSKILGERIDSETAKAIKKTIVSYPGVSGAYDLVIHNYGPEQLVGSVHIEIPDTMKADEIDTLERSITKRVMDEHDIVMTGISVYSVNTKGDTAQRMYESIRAVTDGMPEILQTHGFYVNEEKKTIQLDVVVDFDAKDADAVISALSGEISKMYPEHTVCLTRDYDISD